MLEFTSTTNHQPGTIFSLLSQSYAAIWNDELEEKMRANYRFRGLAATIASGFYQLIRLEKLAAFVALVATRILIITMRAYALDISVR